MFGGRLRNDRILNKDVSEVIDDRRVKYLVFVLGMVLVEELWIIMKILVGVIVDYKYRRRKWFGEKLSVMYIILDIFIGYG